MVLILKFKEKKLNESIENESKLVKSLEEYKSETYQLKSQKKKLEEQNCSLENMCSNLESVVRKFFFSYF